MAYRRKLGSFIFFTLMILVVLPLSAQGPQHFWRQWWDGGRVISKPVLGLGWEENRHAFRIEDGSTSRELRLPEGLGTYHVSFHEGMAYVVSCEGNGEAFFDVPLRLKVFRSPDLKTWEEHGHLSPGPAKGCPNVPFRVAMLSEDLLLGHLDSGFWMDGTGGPLALFRRNYKGEFRLHRVVDLEQKEPYCRLERLPSGAVVTSRNWQRPSVSNLSRECSGRILELPDHVLIVNTSLGSIITLDRMGRFRSRTYLYRDAIASLYKKDRVHIANQALLSILVGLAPTRDGKLLLAARREICLHAQDFHPVDMGRKNIGDIDTQRLNRLAYEDRRSLDPGLEWFLFDPARGTYEEAVAPRNVPKELKTKQALDQFCIRFKPDGNLQVGMTDQDRPSL